MPKDDILKYRATKRDCEDCEYKPRCCPKTPSRKVVRSVYESSRDVARAIAETDACQQSCNERKKVEMLFAHLKRILKLDRLRLRGMNGARDESLLAATAQNLRRMAKPLSRAPPVQGLLRLNDGKPPRLTTTTHHPERMTEKNSQERRLPQNQAPISAV